MSQKTFSLAAGVIFAAIALLHLLRLLYGWQANIGGLDISLWVSGVAFLISLYLAYTGFRLVNRIG